MDISCIRVSDQYNPRTTIAKLIITNEANSLNPLHETIETTTLFSQLPSFYGLRILGLPFKAVALAVLQSNATVQAILCILSCYALL